MHLVLDGLNFIISFCHSSSKVWASSEKTIKVHFLINANKVGEKIKCIEN